MGPFRVLYLDMNSFFASVEQQIDSSLRGRPVAITAMENEKGCCVAASYEAKAYGVKTGTSVPDARRMCPDIVFRPSRHRLYVRYNLQVAAVLDRYAELDRIRSVDEFQMVLSGQATTLEGASELVSTLKAAVANEVGECLRFSAGIGPNHLLAKIAGKLEKPNGFQWLSPENMPQRLSHLSLDDLPGISRSMLARLLASNVKTIAELWVLDPRHARAIWHSIEGERFVRSLQGLEVPLQDTKRGGYGNSKVLAPDFRAPYDAYLVSRWLIEKATMRLRRDNRVAARFSLQISPMDGQGWAANLKCAASQDTATFMRINRQLWRSAWPRIRCSKIATIGVNLSDVEMLEQRSGDLLRPLAPGERSPAERLSAATDYLNGKFGAGTIHLGLNTPHPGFFERG